MADQAQAKDDPRIAGIWALGIAAAARLGLLPLIVERLNQPLPAHLPARTGDANG